MKKWRKHNFPAQNESEITSNGCICCCKPDSAKNVSKMGSTESQEDFMLPESELLAEEYQSKKLQIFFRMFWHDKAARELRSPREQLDSISR